MATINQKIELWRGDARLIHVNIPNRDGTIADLTGEFYWTVAHDLHTAPPLLQKSTLDGGLQRVTGGIQIGLLPIDTTNLAVPVGTHFHQLRLVRLDGTPVIVMTGPFILHAAQPLPP